MTDVPEELQDRFHRLIEHAYGSLMIDEDQEALDQALDAYAIYTDVAGMWDHHLGVAHALRAPRRGTSST